MIKYKALAVQKVNRPLVEFEYYPDPLGPQDAEIEISHCGICRSDIHLIANDWEATTYPFVPGHEIVGTIRSLGDEVTHRQVGDRVGVGWQCSACLACSDCLSGNEQLCVKMKATCVGRHGGFSDHIRVDSRFTFAIPENISSAEAAPLMCGGITAYSPLRNFITKKTARVGVVGLGGVGHFAVLFAKAMGHDVTVFSYSPEKEKLAKDLGVGSFYSSHLEDHTIPSIPKMDFILATANGDLNWTKYIDLLANDGTLCFVGLPPYQALYHPRQLISGRKRISGSPIGSRKEVEEMLSWVSRKNIKPKIEVFSFDDANNALNHTKGNQAQFRVVLQRD